MLQACRICTHLRAYFLAATSLQSKKKKKKKNKDGEMKEQSVWRRRRRSNGRAVMRCVSDAFSDCAVLAAAPVNHDYNGEERWEQWCRKSRSDNYNARDKIMGTRCTLPIISCISSWLTPPLLTTSNHRSYLWNPKWINLMRAVGVVIRHRVCTCFWAQFCQMSKNIYSYFSL